MNTKNTDIGVIIGRFQVAKLHDAHRDLIQTVRAQHAKVIIFLGLAPNLGTKNNPLDFESRKKMLQEEFPDIMVLYINDVNDDEVWSQSLDRILSAPHIVAPMKTVLLYGSRDSFISHYKGKFKTAELIPETVVSGTESRKLTGSHVKGTQDFREGVIWCTQNQYPRVITTVDVVPIDYRDQKFLLGRKPAETAYRFIGGFAEPRGESFESDASRELQEEAGLDIKELEYLGSIRVDDWRYRGEVDKIKTLFFAADMAFAASQTVQAGDDIAEVKWISFAAAQCGDFKDFIVKEHHPLVDVLLKHLKNDI